MNNNLNNDNEIDNSNNDIDKYFEMDSDKSLNSYENDDNEYSYTFNLEDSFDEIKNIKNINKEEKSNKKNECLKNNVKFNQNGNIYNINHKIDNINIISNFDNSSNIENKPNINNNLMIYNNSEIKNISNLNNKGNNINNSFGNNFNNIKNINNSNDILNINFYNNNNTNSNSLKFHNLNNNLINKKIIDDEVDNELFPEITNNININNNGNNIRNSNINNINKDKSNDIQIIDNLSLSSSSSNNIQIVSSEQFRKHFQEDRFGPQRKIEVIDINNTNNKPNLPITQYFDKLYSQKNNKLDYDRCFGNFFMDNNNINNDINKVNINNNKNLSKNEKNNKVNSLFSSKRNKIIHKRKKFSPLSKDKYNEKVYNHEILINNLERKILTDIYNQYQNKDDFEETYYHIDNIKYIINQTGVEEAMNYLKGIEPDSLRTKIIIESTFFFKEIIKEEIEFAENNGGKLILNKPPDNKANNFNMKFNASINGNSNYNKEFNDEGKNINLLNKKNNYYYNNVNNAFNNNEYNKEI